MSEKEVAQHIANILDLVILILAILFGGWPTMMLWNYLATTVFAGLPVLEYKHALALWGLCRVLFKTKSK